MKKLEGFDICITDNKGNTLYYLKHINHFGFIKFSKERYEIMFGKINGRIVA
jgi:hypothetical protein